MHGITHSNGNFDEPKDCKPRIIDAEKIKSVTIIGRSSANKEVLPFVTKNLLAADKNNKFIAKGTKKRIKDHCAFGVKVTFLSMSIFQFPKIYFDLSRTYQAFET
ncbi:MAG: hypothetical protein GY799_14205 [Desulfobulbaceae bacterium]|nr:hypothetical protein [Desulfobulbaceae bacterium]